MGLIDWLRRDDRTADGRGRVRLGPLSDEDRELLELLEEEDRAILEASRPSVVEDIAQLAERMLPAQWTKRRKR